MARIGPFRGAPRWSLWLALIAAAPMMPRGAAAQADDWEVRRDPFDKSVIARYKAILAKQPHDAGALAKLLELYRRYRTVALLKGEYETALAKRPDDWAALVVLAKIQRTSGDAAAALALLGRATTARPGDAAGWLLLGELSRTFAKPAEARAAYEQALARGADKATKSRALRALADLALSANDVDGANRYFKQFLAIDPRNAQLWIEHGDAMLAAKRAEDAVASYAEAEKLLTRDPARRVEVVARRGQALEAAGRDEDAKAEYRRAIKLAPRGYYIEVELTSRIIDIYRRHQDLASLVAESEHQWPAARRGHFEWDTLGKLYEETGAQDKAIDALKRAAAKAPWELETQRRLIQLLENSGRGEEALAQFEAVVRVAPGEARFQLDLVDRYWRRGQERKALDALRKLEARFPGDPGILSAIADLYQRYGKEELAMAAYERLAKIEPDEPNHLVTLGEQYFQRGDKAKAQATWRRIANDKSAKALGRLAEVMAEHNLPLEAIGNFDKAIKLEPKNPELFRGRAAVYESQKQYNDALADWEEVLRLIDPKDRVARRDARRRLVQVLVRTQGRELAYRSRWLAAFGKRDVEAGYFLIEYYAKRPYSSEPLRTLLAMRALVPDDQEILFDLVKVYRGQRDYDRAVAALLEVAKLAPHREAEVFNTIAEIKSEARLDDEAREWAQKALAKNPQNPGAYQRIAELNVSMQRFDDAIAAYERAIALDPRNTKSFFALAELYVQGAQPTKAIELYRRLLRNASDEDVLTRAGREAIDLEEMTGTLGELERTLAPLAFMMSHKAVYRRVLVDLYLRYVPALVEHARRGTEDIKQASRLELRRIGEHGLRPLLEALRDEKDLTQQKVAVSVLGHLGNKGAALPLVNLARQEPKPEPGTRRAAITSQGLEWELRIDALIAAGRLGDASILPEVVPLLSHGEASLIEAATFTLGRTADRRAQPHLLKALEDRRESVQTLACLGFAQQLDARSAATVTAVVANGLRADAVRAACAYALGIQRVASASTALAQAVNDNRGQASRLAAWALGQLGDERAVVALIRGYLGRAQQDDAVLRWALARTTSAGLSPSPATDFREYPMRADRFDPVARVEALPGELPSLPLPEKLLLAYERPLGDALIATLSEHRDVALTVLGDLNAGERRIGVGALTPGAPSARAAAALERVGVRLLPALERLTTREDSETRAAAILALAKAAPTTSPALTNRLGALVHDGSALVRASALQAIPILSARLGQPPAALLRLIQQALVSADWEDRRAAALALGRLDAQQPVELLTSAASDSSSLVREAVARALGRGPAAAVDALLALSRDPVAAVRAAAAEGLARQRDPRAQGRLRELASDPSPTVRAAAR
ncbi:MAG: HEAT repeat domain-containing protein [Kofleriaceae bacterium]